MRPKMAGMGSEGREGDPGDCYQCCCKKLELLGYAQRSNTDLLIRPTGLAVGLALGTALPPVRWIRPGNLSSPFRCLQKTTDSASRL
jgi:hypothetical protein